MDQHMITYFGSKRLGFSWECTCGVGARVALATAEERREDVARHRATHEVEEPVQEFEVPPTGEVEYQQVVVTEGAQRLENVTAFVTKPRRQWGERGGFDMRS